MKNLHYIVIALCSFGVLYATAEFVPPASLPPEGNVAPPLNTGNTPQIRRGQLGIQITNSNLELREGSSLTTDSTIAVEHAEYLSSNSSWLPNTSVYGFDSNAPISVNGLFSTGIIRSEKSVVAPEIKVDALKVENSLGGSSQLCGDTVTGELEVCTTAVGSQLQVSVTAEPASVLPGGSVSPTIEWQATPSAEKCIALEGAGFTTDDEIMGSKKASSITLANGESAQYVVACNDAYGNTKIASTQVQAVEQPPKITFSINPPTGNWSQGAFFTTGLVLNPNGGGTMTCKKRVEGMAVSPTNSWSGQASGQWSSPIAVPPANSQTVNTCYGGCQFKNIVTQPNQSALLSIQCSNSGATTTESRWISVGE